MYSSLLSTKYNFCFCTWCGVTSFAWSLMILYPTSSKKNSILNRFIEECWYAEAVVRPTFSDIIVRLERIFVHCSTQGWWKLYIQVSLVKQFSLTNSLSQSFFCNMQLTRDQFSHIPWSLFS